MKKFASTGEARGHAQKLKFSHTTKCPGGPRIWKNTLNTEEIIVGLTHTMPMICLGDHAATIRPVELVTTGGDER
jgi:hypothetical protein